MSDGVIRPLAGVRVLELGNYIAAPTAGRMLADFGAEVIKVERPITGDELRNWRLYAGDTSMLFRTINRNKKSITVDLRSDEGRAIVLDLLRTCDVLLENFRPGTLEKWGLGPEILDGINPDLVITRISAFGQTGPLAQRPGFAAVAEAVGGLRELVGDPDRPPVRVGVSIGDSIAGIHAAFGTVMALFAREVARGHAAGPIEQRQRIIDVALNESILSVMESLVPDYLAYGVQRERVGGRMEGIAPSNAYPCSDGTSVIISGNADGIFGRYMRVIDRPDLAADLDLRTNAGRWERRDELDDAISQWTGNRTRDEVLRILDEAQVPSGPIYTASDIVADEQYAARNMIQHFDVDTGEAEMRRVGFPGIVPVIGGSSLPIRNVGPDLGQHTEEILSQLLDSSVRSETIHPQLRDVTLRDGLQLTGKLLPTDRKVGLARDLLGLGVPYLEIGSMARGDLVPPMANTLEVISALTPEELERCWVWVATPRHIIKAAAAGARNFQYCLSASDSHNRANIGRTTEESVAAFPEAAQLTADMHGRIQLCIATSFTCPFEGAVPVERVVGIAADPRTAAADDVVLADTLGQAVPVQVTQLFTAVRASVPERRMVYHGHDTWGLGVANTLAAIAAGASMVDGSLGGLGGCPFAPGAAGNTSTEDLLFATRPEWFRPATLATMLGLTEKLLAELGEPNRSRTVQGARSQASAFEWAAPSPAR